MINNSHIHEDRYKLIVLGNSYRMTGERWFDLTDIRGNVITWSCSEGFIVENFIPFNSKLARLVYL